MDFIHMADVHLGACPDSDRPWGKQRGNEIWETFRDVIKVAAKEKTDLLLISGDLFHRQPLVRELKEVNDLFSTIPDTKVVLIAGNHDYIKPESAYLKFPWSENVTGLWEKTCRKVHFSKLKTTVYGISYHRREILREAYQDLHADREPGNHILMLHGEEGCLPLREEQLREMGFSYLALGHIHKPGKVGKLAVYPGSPEPMDKNELGRHGYIKGKIVDGRVSISFVPVAKREYIPLTLTVEPHTSAFGLKQQVEKEIEKQGTEHLYKIRLQGLRDPELSFSEEMLADICHLADFEDATRPDYDLEQLAKRYRGTLVGDYIESFSGDQTPAARAALYEGLHALLEAGI